MKTALSLYLDVDDVIADWNKEATSYLKKQVNTHSIPTDDWSRITEHGRFYKDLDLLPGALELVNWARDYTTRKGMFLAFLTAIPHTNTVPYAAYDKSLWAYKRFPDIPLFIGPYPADKYLHCKPGDILIDDRHENCMDWAGAGGIACRYSTWESCKEWIKDALGEEVV